MIRSPALLKYLSFGSIGYLSLLFHESLKIKETKCVFVPELIAEKAEEKVQVKLVSNDYFDTNVLSIHFPPVSEPLKTQYCDDHLDSEKNHNTIILASFPIFHNKEKELRDFLQPMFVEVAYKRKRPFYFPSFFHSKYFNPQLGRVSLTWHDATLST